MTRLILACLVLAGCSGAANSPLTEPSGDSGVIVGEPDARAAPDVLAVPLDAGVDAFVAPPSSIDAGHDTGPVPVDAGVDVWKPPTCAQMGGAVCDGVCNNLNDDQNCGACGTVCPPAEMCMDLACIQRCTGIYGSFCNGVCANVQNDSQNCGACGTVCPPGGVCTNWTCVPE